MNTLLSVENQLAERLELAELQPLTGGRTNRVWKSGDKVLKLFSEHGETPLFGNSANQEWAALKALDGLGIGPKPIAKHETEFGKILIYKHIAGPFGVPKIEDAARLLGRLHEFEPRKDLGLAISQNVVQMGADMLPNGHSLTRSRPMEIRSKFKSLLHRDPVFTNFISGPDGLRLVDWQCPGIGDPVEDIAHFISPAMNLLYRKKILKNNEIKLFLGSYPTALTITNYEEYGRSYHWRMACYCAWQVARSNVDYIPALKAETDFLAEWPL